MKTNRSIKITVEREEVLLIKQHAQPLAAWCAECDERVRLVTLEEAIALTGESSRAIHRRAEAGQLHFAETADGFLLICLNSLACSTGSVSDRVD